MELIVLRFIHVVGGAFWVGTVLFVSFFLLPALSQTGPAMGQVMGALQRRGMMTVLPIVALLTILSGLRLMWITSAGFTAAYFSTPVGRTYAVAALAALLALLLGVFVARPAAARAAQLASSGSSPDAVADLERVRRRAAVVGTMITTLLLIAAAGMAVARYV